MPALRTRWGLDIAYKTTGSSESFSNNIYTQLGVRPVINCVGTWTYLTASLELPEVREAAERASHYFVDLYELEAAAGRRLAQMSGGEAAMITSGSAGAISAGAAACIAGSDPKNIYQLPDTTGMKGPRASCERGHSDHRIQGDCTPAVNGLKPTVTRRPSCFYISLHDDISFAKS